MAAIATESVLGVDCFVGDMDSAVEAVCDRARTGKGGYACLANVHTLVTAVHDPPLRGALENAWMVFPDGSPVAWVQRRAGAKDAMRIAGPDLMTHVLNAQQPDLRHFLYGSTPSVLDSMSRRLDGVTICGAFAPPFAPVDSYEFERSLAAVRSARPDIVWCGLGMPKQELWMRRYAVSLAPALVLGVGAAFDFLGGTKPRAPIWMQTAGLEWLHRLVSEPRRLGGRYGWTNSEFLCLLAWEILHARRKT